MSNRILYLLTPPILLAIYRRVFSKNNLFDGCDEIFLEALACADEYLEFGIGQTSKIVDKQENIKKAIGVDTSEFWIKKISKSIISKDKVKFHFVDVGPLGEWGTPLDYRKRHNFKQYIDFVKLNEISPDLILIDGRFRVATFLSCMLHAPAGTCIIFDDYTYRSCYHIVEEVIQPIEKNERQAKFIVPLQNKLNVSLINSLIEKFEYVMD